MTSSDEATSTPLSNRPLSARAQRAVTAMKAATAAKRSPRVLVDPSDPATIERAAQAMYEHKMDCDGPDYSDLTAASKRYWCAGAAAVLASLTDTGDNKEQTNA